MLFDKFLEKTLRKYSGDTVLPKNYSVEVRGGWFGKGREGKHTLYIPPTRLL